MKNNPYAGPRPFERGEANFCGREREARELLWLILAERAVLFYAQSGAGKTSLLNARVIPDLEKKGFVVPPVVRVGSDLPPGVAPGAVDNIFVFSALMGLTEGQPVSLEKLPGYTLGAFLNEFYLGPQEAETRRPLVLIVDQFEELFTRHPERWQDGLGFFQQLRQALDTTPGLSVVLAMREDHLAGLDPYLPLLPSQLQARFRLELLDRKQAQEAIEKPACQAGYEFEEGAVRQLVTNLSQIKVQRYGAEGIEEVTANGQYIEPVQLQVVCRQLWANLEEPQDGLIPWQEVREHGDVTRALTGFYTQSLEQAARETGVKERDLRRWFSERLITPVHTRGLALQDAQDTAGLPNAAVQVLEQAHLIRADLRAGARWYELSHDRLVEPIVQSNRAWEAARQTPLRITARQWQGMKSAGLLYRERALREARAWASTHLDEVEPYEQEFLDASLQAEQNRIRRRRWYISGGAIGLLIVAVMAILTVMAVRGQEAAQTAESTAEARRQEAVTQANIAGTAQAQAVTQADLAATARVQALAQADVARTAQAQAVNQADLAATAQARAEAQTHISEYRRVAAQAIANQNRVPDLALLLGAEASYMEDNGETRSALLNVLQSNFQLTTYLRGHTGWVSSIAFSPDGKLLASGSVDNTIRLWDMNNHQPVGEPLKGHANEVYSIAFSPDGKILASGSSDNTIRLWDVITRQMIGNPLKGHTNDVYSVTFSPNSKILASGSFDNTIRLWDTLTGQPVGQLRHNDVNSVAFSPDGKILASGSWDNTIRLWDMSTLQMVDELWQAYGGVMASLAFSPDGKLLASGNGGAGIGTIILWDVITRQPVGEPLKGHTGQVTSIAFSPDGKILASGSWDHTIRLWDVTTHQMSVEPLKGYVGVVPSVAFSPDGKFLASSSQDNAIRLWYMTTHQPVGERLKGNTSQESSVAFSPDGKILASGSWENAIQLWDVITRQPIGAPLKGHIDGVTSIAFSPDGKTLASGSHDKTIILWDMNTRQQIGAPLKGHTASINRIAFSPDSKILASGSQDQIIILWNMNSRQPIYAPLSVYSVAFSLDGKTLALGSMDKTIILWNMNTGQPIGAPLKGHTESVISMAFSPDSKILASGSWDKTIILWNVNTGQPIGAPLSGHTDAVTSLAFSPDGKILASSSLDKTTVLWDTTTRQPIGQSFKGDGIVTFSLDGKILALGGDDGLILDISPSSWRTRACQIANRNLTRAEWMQYINPDPASYAAEYALHPTCPGLPVE